MIVLEVLVWVVLAFFVSMMVSFATCKLITIRFKSAGKRRRAMRLWFCRRMEWHEAPTSPGFDGCSMNGRCPVCHRRVLLDSQGGWFSATQGDSYREPTP